MMAHVAAPSGPNGATAPSLQPIALSMTTGGAGSQRGWAAHPRTAQNQTVFLQVNVCPSNSLSGKSRRYLDRCYNLELNNHLTIA